MRSNTVKICAVVLLVAQAVVLAQKTEVRVQKGKVVAQTANTTVAVDAGRKAVITPGSGIVTAVDDPMVDDLIRIYGWVQQEKQAQRERIDSASIQMVRIESESRFTLAYLREVPNSASRPSDTCPIPGASILDNPVFYDLQGNRLSFDLQRTDARSGDYFVRFPEPVQPGKDFCFICVSELDGSMFKDGSLWHLQICWNAPNCLNYFRFVLPASAVFVDSSRDVVVADSFGGNPAVTTRNYTGAVGDGLCHIAFLWPQKDGTTLADLPPQYRGLRDEHDLDIVRAGNLQLTKILAGEPFIDQSNPVAAVGTLASAIIRKDKPLLLNLMANPVLRTIADSQYDEFIQSQGRQLVEGVDFLSTPTWPEQPQDGYEHRVYFSRKGSLLHDATMVMVYRDGKWYSGGMTWGAEHPETTPQSPAVDAVKISRDRADLSAATYQGFEPGRFLRRWLFLGPIDIPWHGEGYFPNDQAQREFFGVDQVAPGRFQPQIQIGDKSYLWAVLDSEYGVIGLSAVVPDWFKVGYAWAQIDMPEEKSAVLGIGSDDHVKVWLNGKLVHENWVSGGRGVVPDNDRVPVTFKKGTNQLVLKIQNGGGAWGFACRLLTQ
ncbi:MAG: hypothetical protein ABFE13_27425 [Phycisphaerales bacterium]